MLGLLNTEFGIPKSRDFLAMSKDIGVTVRDRLLIVIGKKQAEVSVKSGLSVSTIAGWDKPNVTPRAHLLQKVRSAYNLSLEEMDYIQNGFGPPPPGLGRGREAVNS